MRFKILIQYLNISILVVWNTLLGTISIFIQNQNYQKYTNESKERIAGEYELKGTEKTIRID